jgi:hypothetical protein
METRTHPWGWPWLLLALVLVAFGVFVGYRLIHSLWAFEYEFDAQCEQIRKGMTEAEVAAVFGRDGGILRLNYREANGEYEKCWGNGTRLLVIVFSPGRNGRVQRAWLDDDFGGRWVVPPGRASLDDLRR